MARPPGALYGVAAISVVLVILCVLLHYEVLRKLSDWLDRMGRLHRTRVLVLILGLLATHIVEIWIYAGGYGLVDGMEGFGTIAKTGVQSMFNALFWVGVVPVIGLCALPWVVETKDRQLAD